MYHYFVYSRSINSLVFNIFFFEKLFYKSPKIFDQSCYYYSRTHNRNNNTIDWRLREMYNILSRRLIQTIFIIFHTVFIFKEQFKPWLIYFYLWVLWINFYLIVSQIIWYKLVVFSNLIQLQNNIASALYH